MQVMLYTSAGWMDLEEQYIPAVVSAETIVHKWAAAQAIAIVARTYVLRAVREDPKLGTEEKPIESSERFQLFASSATGEGKEAAQATKRLVCRYGGQLILCNSVAGALWTGKGSPGEDPTDSEKWVTYNEGKAGKAVKPSSISLVSRPDNRGCLSKHGAEWLASEATYDFPAILRYFYGADLEVAPFNVPSPTPHTAPQPTPRPPTKPATPTNPTSPPAEPPRGPAAEPPTGPLTQPASVQEAPKTTGNDLPLPVIAALAMTLFRGLDR